MSFITAFIIGAIFGVLQFAYSWLRKPIYGGHPFQAIAFMIVVGGLFYGTIIWLVAKLF